MCDTSKLTNDVRHIVIFVAIALFASAAVAFSGDIRITALSTSIRAHDRAAWRIELNQKFDNPFDPDVIAVDAKFSGPDHRVVTVPAFWYVDPKDKAGSFVARFVPPAAGEWSVSVVANKEQSLATRFQVVENPSPRSFVLAPETGARYFKFESGETYFPIGLNLAWPGDAGLPAYRDWFESLSKAGGNFARIWICHPNRPYETKQLGPGKYDQDVCAYYDDVLEMAESRGVCCMLTFNNHRDLLDRDQYGAAQWPEQPLNSINGGPCTRPSDFITNATARKFYRQRLRYSIARWSAYSSVFCWELWNEQSFARVEIPPEWTAEMAQYIRSIDPVAHPISTSFGQLPQPEVWRLPEIALTQDHLYPGESGHDSSLPVSSAILELRKYEKPAFVAELGIGEGVWDTKVDPQSLGTNMHNAMWATTLSGACGAASLWSWNDYVAPKGIWWQFTPVARFVKSVDFANHHFAPIQLSPAMTQVSSEETFSDIVIPAGGNWTPSHGLPITILPNGQALLNLPRYMVSEIHKDIITPTVLHVDLPAASQFIVRVNTVSEVAMLRVLIDGKPTVDFPFSALPGAPGQESTKKNGTGGTYTAIFHKYCQPVEIPAGQHKIELRNVGGDWLTLESLTFTRAKSSRFADLHTLAMRDEKTGDVIGWVHDPASNWFSDSNETSPRTIEGATLTLPPAADASYEVQWWDTWHGVTIRTDHLAANEVKLALPPITRDVAFRARLKRN